MSDSVGGEIMLFGVRVKVDPMRKSVSMNNLSQYEQPLNNNNDLNNNNNNDLVKAAEDGGAVVGYASADDAVPLPSNGTRERKRGVPWTEEEHKQFLIGLQKVGKGDWRGISRNYVKTRTPTQVASHAQKYFLRRTNINRRRRRSSLFDITTDSVTAMPIVEVRNRQESPALPPAVAHNINGFSVVPFPVLLSMQGGNVMENAVLCQSDQVNNSSSMMVMPVPVLPMPTSSTMMVDFNLNRNIPTERFPLSLNLSLSSGQDLSSTRDSILPVMPSFNGDSLLTVA